MPSNGLITDKKYWTFCIIPEEKYCGFVSGGITRLTEKVVEHGLCPGSWDDDEWFYKLPKEFLLNDI